MQEEEEDKEEINEWVQHNTLSNTVKDKRWWRVNARINIKIKQKFNTQCIQDCKVRNSNFLAGIISVTWR